MTISERRRLSRTVLNTPACILIEEDKIGVALNISGEGLHFQSMFPVERKELLCCSFVQDNRFIDACGELAWLDAAQTSGGLHFTTLSTEARGRVNEWTSQSLASPEAHDKAWKPVMEAATLCVAEPVMNPRVREPGKMGCTSKLRLVSSLRALCRQIWVREAHVPNRRHRLVHVRALKTTRSVATRGSPPIARDSTLYWRTWNSIVMVVKRCFWQKWLAMLDSIRVVAISAAIDQIFERRYRAGLRNVSAEDERRLLSQFLEDTKALEQERLTIASRRTVRRAEKYKIDIPGEKFKYNRYTETLVLPVSECLRVQRQIARQRRMHVESRILWLAPLLGAMIALLSVWLAMMLKSGH